VILWLTGPVFSLYFSLIILIELINLLVGDRKSPTVILPNFLHIGDPLGSPDEYTSIYILVTLLGHPASIQYITIHKKTPLAPGFISVGRVARRSRSRSSGRRFQVGRGGDGLQPEGSAATGPGPNNAGSVWDLTRFECACPLLNHLPWHRLLRLLWGRRNEVECGGGRGGHCRVGFRASGLGWVGRNAGGQVGGDHHAVVLWEFGRSGRSSFLRAQDRGEVFPPIVVTVEVHRLGLGLAEFPDIHHHDGGIGGGDVEGPLGGANRPVVWDQPQPIVDSNLP
jgi:hypothetical protein